ncbi:MAG: rRNA maturation RNase YbeY [Persicimonas sp.]
MELADPELSVLLTDNEHIQSLNERWRGVDEPTDVLSFPLHEPEKPGELPDDVRALGDVVISLEYAESLLDTDRHRHRVAEQLELAPEQLEWELLEEVVFLLIHGLLHLVGYDHAHKEDERRMKAAERRLWQAAHPGRA